MDGGERAADFHRSPDQANDYQLDLVPPYGVQSVRQALMGRPRMPPARVPPSTLLAQGKRPVRSRIACPMARPKGSRGVGSNLRAIGAACAMMRSGPQEGRQGSRTRLLAGPAESQQLHRASHGTWQRLTHTAGCGGRAARTIRRRIQSSITTTYTTGPWWIGVIPDRPSMTKMIKFQGDNIHFIDPPTPVHSLVTV